MIVERVDVDRVRAKLEALKNKSTFAPVLGKRSREKSPEATKELSKIPFFVRGKAKRNTERYAAEQGLETISIEALYDAKSHFAR